MMCNICARITAWHSQNFISGIGHKLTTTISREKPRNFNAAAMQISNTVYRANYQHCVRGNKLSRNRTYLLKYTGEFQVLEKLTCKTEAGTRPWVSGPYPVPETMFRPLLRPASISKHTMNILNPFKTVYLDYHNSLRVSYLFLKYKINKLCS